MQKQTATILSAELPGFQTLTEALPPKELSTLMNDIHTLIENTVRLHQGTIKLNVGGFNPNVRVFV